MLISSGFTFARARLLASLPTGWLSSFVCALTCAFIVVLSRRGGVWFVRHARRDVRGVVASLNARGGSLLCS